MQKGQFVISLDFELMWGVRDKRTIESYGTNVLGVRQVIPSLLDLFGKYGINATFATVGFLFAQNKEHLLRHRPTVLPNYPLKKYSPYEGGYLDNIGHSEADDLYHYAPSLIRQILQQPGQEMASHTFSHYYCLENASLESFEADMKAAKEIAAGYGTELKSIVFPRNQYGPEHLAICRKLGFIAYRGNEQSAVYNPRSNEDLNPLIRATRLADAYINLTGHHSYEAEAAEGLVNIPASRFLRPYSHKLRHADGLRLNRICSGMTNAARTKTIYHLWWHPHNFGRNLPQNLAFLEQVLKHFKKLQQKWGMESRTMKSIAEEIIVPQHAV